MPTAIAIIGAGLAGAWLARRLLDSGYPVSVFEKSRGSGGRLSSCRLGNYSADLGAPWLETGQSSAFDHWLAAQPDLHPWQPSSQDWQGQPQDAPTVYLPDQRLSALTRRLLSGADLHTGCRVSTLMPSAAGVALRGEDGAVYSGFQQVILTAPAPQAAELLAPWPALAEQADAVPTAPCWVGVFALESSAAISAEQYSGGHHPLLARVVQDSAKPGRASALPVWQVQANPQWSCTHQEQPPEWVGQQLLAALSELAGQPLTAVQQRVHRWLYCHHPTPCEATYLWDKAAGIAACGDWLGRPGSAGAWLSAQALADQLIPSLAKP